MKNFERCKGFEPVARFLKRTDIHNRNYPYFMIIPVKKDSTQRKIGKYMPGYTYEKMIEDLKSSNWIKEVNENSNMYFRILAIRLLFE